MLKAKAYREGKDEITPVESGEEGLKIIKALTGYGDIVTNVNLPNNAQMPDLPKGAVVETNAAFKYDSDFNLLISSLDEYIPCVYSTVNFMNCDPVWRTFN